MLIPVGGQVAGLLRSEDGLFALATDGGKSLRAKVHRGGERAHAIAGPRSRGSADFEGRGVWYWASPIEAKLCTGQEVVPGRRWQFGRSGRGVSVAAMPARCRMVIRGGGLGASMSRYLIERIEATPIISS